MRAFLAAAASIVCLLPAVSPPVSANSACKTAFEKWALLSSARVRTGPQAASNSSGGNGACIPSEAARRELLNGLARALALCVSAPNASDRAVQQTATMLIINQSFVSSLALCRTDSAAPGADWNARSAPAPAKKEAPPPKAAVAAPPPPPPKPAVAASPPPPPKPVVAAPPPRPPCLEIAPSKEGRYALVNRRCSGHTVFAVVETRGAAGETVCRGFTISRSVAVQSSRNAPPLINHECVLNEHGPCNRDRLGGMFPECDF